jgi:hypothetical protein
MLKENEMPDSRNEMVDSPNEHGDGETNMGERTIAPVARARKGAPGVSPGGAREGYLYFVQLGNHGQVLLGHHQRSPKRAIADLQLANPEPLRVLGITNGTLDDLAKLHKRFRDTRRSGDWHEPTPELLEWIARQVHVEPTWKPQKRNHRSVAYTLPQWAIDRLAELAEGWNTTKSGALQRLLDESCDGKTGREIPTSTREDR